MAPSLTLGMNGPTRLTLSFLHQTDDNLPDFGVPALNGKRLDGVSREAYFGWRNLDKEKIQSNALTAKLEHDFSADLKLQNLTRYSSLSRDTTVSASHVDLRHAAGYYKPAGPQGYGRDSTTEMWVNQTNLTSKFDTFGLGHTLVTGFEISRETYDRTTYSYNINRYYPAGGFELARPPGRWDGPTSKSASARNKTSLDTKALYAMDTIALGRMFDVSLGLRYDWIDATSSSRPVGGTRLDVDSADRKLSTRVGLTFKPAENGRIYVPTARPSIRRPNSWSPRAAAWMPGTTAWRRKRTARSSWAPNGNCWISAWRWVARCSRWTRPMPANRWPTVATCSPAPSA